MEKIENFKDYELRELNTENKVLEIISKLRELIGRVNELIEKEK